MTKREEVLRGRSTWVFIGVALCAVIITNLTIALTWPVWVEVLLFGAVYSLVYWAAEKILFRRSDG